MKKVILAIIGIVLAVSVIATGTYDLAKEDIEIYEQAIAVENVESNFGFKGFALTDYPVSFYDGDKDYVVKWEDGNYIIKNVKQWLIL